MVGFRFENGVVLVDFLIDNSGRFHVLVPSTAHNPLDGAVAIHYHSRNLF